MAQITVSSGRCWQYSHYIGRQGGVGKGFSTPAGVAPGKDDVLYVANRGTSSNPRISKISLDHEFIKEFGRFGEEEGQMTWLTAVALDQDENVYTTDEWLHRITVFDSEGELLATWGQAGEQEGQINGPSGLAFDPDDNVWIVNSHNSRVQRFTKNGQWLGGFGVKGSAEGELDMPWGITIDNEGDIYVADWNNHRVQKFSPQGAHLLTFGSGKRTGVSHDGGTPYIHQFQAHIPVNPKDLNHPTGMAVDGDGDVYVADWMNERVVIFDAKAEPLVTLRGEGAGLSPWAQLTIDTNPTLGVAWRRAKNPENQNYFRMPLDCAFDQANQRLLVCDTLRDRLQIYHKDKEYKDPPRNL